MPKKLALQGQRFGRLVVIHETTRTIPRRVRWECQCDCGNRAAVTTNELRRGDTKSCGCLNREAASRRGKASTIHGHSESTGLERKSYKAWSNMLDRCLNPKNKSFSGYGGRGVKVCDRWNPRKGGSYVNFVEDMGLPPSSSYSLDKDKLGGIGGTLYGPDTCCWMPQSEQCRYTRRCRFVIYNGKRMALTAAAEMAGINEQTVFSRIYKGWPESRWFEPVK